MRRNTSTSKTTYIFISKELLYKDLNSHLSQDLSAQPVYAPATAAFNISIQLLT